jgi:hypothetical protein
MNQEQLEQQQMLLTLMGSVYGEAKKMDQHIVGTSKDLKPTSEHIKNMFEGVLKVAQSPSPPPASPSPTPPQLLPAAINLPHVIQQPQESKPIQLVENTDIVSTLKGIENNLSKLVEIFTQYEVKVKKTTNRKVSRSGVEDQRSVHHESGKGQDIVDSNIDGQHADPLRSSKPFE